MLYETHHSWGLWLAYQNAAAAWTQQNLAGRKRGKRWTRPSKNHQKTAITDFPRYKSGEPQYEWRWKKTAALITMCGWDLSNMTLWINQLSTFWHHLLWHSESQKSSAARLRDRHLSFGAFSMVLQVSLIFLYWVYSCQTYSYIFMKSHELMAYSNDVIFKIRELKVK